MSDDPKQDEMEEEFEVVELESEDGEREEFVVVDRIETEDKNYAIMALMEDIQNLESMDEDEFREYYGDDTIFFVMRQDGDSFVELTDEEYDSIQEEMERRLSQA